MELSKLPKQKLLFIYGPMGPGGAERVLIDVLNNIDYSKYEVDLALICRGEGVRMDELPQELNIIELWPGYSFSYRMALLLSRKLHCNWLFAKKMNSSKLRGHYDLEISFLEGMPLKLHACRKSSSKKVTWIHTDPNLTGNGALFYPGEELSAYNKMDVVVNVSKDCMLSFKEYMPACQSDIRVIYNPIDRDKIVQKSKDDSVVKPHSADMVQVISVGRLAPQKNPRRFLEIAKKCKEAGLKACFKWVGNGDMMDEMIELRNRWRLQDVVEFTGYTSNPYSHIRHADILMVPSDYEGFCLVICEAMCLGVPVISTATVGPSEILDGNKYGVLTDVDTESLFKALRYWIENPEEREKYAKLGAVRPDDYSVANTIFNIELILSSSN